MMNFLRYKQGNMTTEVNIPTSDINIIINFEIFELFKIFCIIKYALYKYYIQLIL